MYLYFSGLYQSNQVSKDVTAEVYPGLRPVVTTRPGTRVAVKLVNHHFPKTDIFTTKVILFYQRFSLQDIIIYIRKSIKLCLCVEV